jgi:hypothetical protein
MGFYRIFYLDLERISRPKSLPMGRNRPRRGSLRALKARSSRKAKGALFRSRFKRSISELDSLKFPAAITIAKGRAVLLPVVQANQRGDAGDTAIALVGNPIRMGA